MVGETDELAVTVWPALSESVRTTEYVPVLAKTCVPPKVVTPAERSAAGSVEPSPQSTETAWLSARSASANVRARVDVPPSLPAVTSKDTMLGAWFGFWTLTVAVAVAVAPALSATVAVTVKSPAAAYVCAAEVNVGTAAARFMLVAAEPSPQSTVTVCASAAPASVNAPVAVTAWPASTVAEERAKEVIDGTAFRTVTPRNRVFAKSGSRSVTEMRSATGESSR